MGDETREADTASQSSPAKMGDKLGDKRQMRLGRWTADAAPQPRWETSWETRPETRERRDQGGERSTPAKMGDKLGDKTGDKRKTRPGRRTQHPSQSGHT